MLYRKANTYKDILYIVDHITICCSTHPYVRGIEKGKRKGPVFIILIPTASYLGPSFQDPHLRLGSYRHQLWPSLCLECQKGQFGEGCRKSKVSQ